MLENYNLEIPRIIKEIKKAKAKKVCIQLPDGLKPFATRIAKELEDKTEAKIFIWAGTNFGGCDLPLCLKDKFDLLINFGHARFKRF